ncbi:MAG: CoA-binding protein [Terriglobia bacterium]|jgi:predicted CoA-binding protein
MREASLEDITRFLECKRVAFVGASRHPRHFSRAVLREFLAKGYDPVPVNPQATEIEGRKCFARISDITPPVEAALLMTGPPDATDQAMCECTQAGIMKIWIYRSVNDGHNHGHAVEFCRSQGSDVVEGYCPFMFLPHPGLVHRLHRFIMKVGGNYPL